MNYDIKAEIINLRKTKTPFGNKYRPAFSISNKQNYLTTGEIVFEDQNYFLKFNEKSIAFISFLTPEIYPHTLWVGKNLEFYEGSVMTGKARIFEIYNKLLETDQDNENTIKY